MTLQRPQGLPRTILSHLPRRLDAAALVFPNSEGHCDLRWAQRTVPAAVRAAKIEGFRFHDLRHTFASRLAMAGVDLLTIKDLGGWKSLAMVQRYAHLSPSHRRMAIERLVIGAERAGEGPASRSGVAPEGSERIGGGATPRRSWLPVVDTFRAFAWLPRPKSNGLFESYGSFLRPDRD